MSRMSKHHGFTLIELLIVVAIIGIIAAIVIPNLLDAVQKAKQKRTVADIRNTGTAWMSWLTDQAGAASAGADKKYDASNHVELDYEEVYGYLHPSSTFFYMQDVPQLDGWRYSLRFGKNQNLQAHNALIICSFGRDGTSPDPCVGTHFTIAPFVATDYNQEIIWADGYMVKWPGQLTTN